MILLGSRRGQITVQKSIQGFLVLHTYLFDKGIPKFRILLIPRLFCYLVSYSQGDWLFELIRKSFSDRFVPLLFLFGKAAFVSRTDTLVVEFTLIRDQNALLDRLGSGELLYRRDKTLGIFLGHLLAMMMEP